MEILGAIGIVLALFLFLVLRSLLIVTVRWAIWDRK